MWLALLFPFDVAVSPPSREEAILVHEDHTSLVTLLCLSSETLRELVPLLDGWAVFSRDRLRLVTGDGPRSVKRGATADEPDAAPVVDVCDSTSSSRYEISLAFLGRSVLVLVEVCKLALGVVIFAGQASG
jgi:hypothetical protein